MIEYWWRTEKKINSPRPLLDMAKSYTTPHVSTLFFTVSCFQTVALLLGDCSTLCSRPMPLKFWSINTSFYLMVMWCKKALLQTKLNLTPRANNGGIAITVMNTAYGMSRPTKFMSNTLQNGSGMSCDTYPDAFHAYRSIGYYEIGNYDKNRPELLWHWPWA